MASFLHRNFMREIGREHARLWTDKIHDEGQSRLVSLTPHIKITAGKVVANWPLATKLAVFVFPFEPVNDHGNPPRSSFHKPHPQFRKRIPYPILNHPCHRNGQRQRHSQRSCAWELGEGVESEIAVTAAVDTNSAVQLLRLLVNRPELFCAEVFL